LANPAKTAEANAQFKKTQREQDGKKAMAEYEADGIAMRAKTAKLKALRLAREAELAATAAVAGKKPAKTAKTKSPTLSDFQRDMDRGGRFR
jgi:hypothetical protein